MIRHRQVPQTLSNIEDDEESADEITIHKSIHRYDMTRDESDTGSCTEYPDNNNVNQSEDENDAADEDIFFSGEEGARGEVGHNSYSDGEGEEVPNGPTANGD